MIPKNNIKERIRKMDSQREHHAIRKLTTGAASVLISLTFMGTTGRSVKASTGNENSEAGIELEVKANSTDTSQSEAVSQETTQNNQTSEVTTETSVVENTEVQTDQAVTQNDTARETPAQTAQNEAATSQIQENTEATTSQAAETTAPVASQTENNTEVATETAPVQNTETTQSQVAENTNSVKNQTNTVTPAENNTQTESQAQDNVNTENITVDNSTNEQQVAEKVENSTEVKDSNASTIETQTTEKAETTPEIPAPSAPKADIEVSDKVENLGETRDKELTTDDKVKDPNKDKEADKVENDNIIDLNAADTEGKVVINATDPNNYPTDAGKLVGDDKYIYQIVTLNGTSFRLVLAINRNDHNDESIYAYVTNSNYSSASQTFEIKVGNNRVITVGNHKYQINNTGKSDVTIDNGNGTTTKVPTENTSTITGQPGWIDTDRISPIYGLGNTTNNNYTALGEIIPVYTENSVIKYYYKDSEGKLHEIEGSDQ